MVLGFPLASTLIAREKQRLRLAEATLRSIRVPRLGQGRPRTRPRRLTADRAHDSRGFRQYLRARGIRACIPPRRRPAGWKRKRGRPIVVRKEDYARRWIVERTFAWLGHFRRLLIRWERRIDTYSALIHFALALLCLRRA
jgi:transposase